MPKREPNLDRKLTHTIKPTRGPAAQLETLADAAQLTADLEEWRQARTLLGSLRRDAFARGSDRPEGGCWRSYPVRYGRVGERELAEGSIDAERLLLGG